MGGTEMCKLRYYQSDEQIEIKVGSEQDQKCHSAKHQRSLRDLDAAWGSIGEKLNRSKRRGEKICRDSIGS